MKKGTQKITMAVYGAAHSEYSKSMDVIEQAENLGTIIAKHDCITVVPATTGFPMWVAKGAHNAGGQVIGFSPAASEREHVQVYDAPTKNMDMIIYSGFGYAGSDLLLSRSSDAIIFGYGGLESAHEFWVAFQENKPIGILKGEWSTDEVLFGLLRGHESTFDHSRIIMDDDPQRLLEQLIKKAKDEKTQSFHM